MGNNFFPKNYISNNGLLELLLFLSEFKQKLINALKEHWWLIEVESPLITDKINPHFRTIDFDNKYNANIYSIIDYPDNYLAQLFRKIKYTDKCHGIISICNVINRDCLINNTNFLCSKTWDLRIKLEPNESQYFVSLVNDYYEKIIEIMGKTLQTISIPHNLKTHINNFIGINKIITAHSEIILEEKKINHLCSKYGCIGLIYNQNNKISEQLKMFTNDNIRFLSEILIYHSLISKPISIMNINISRIEDNSDNPCYLHICININNILMLLLNKSHLGEIIPGVWQDNVVDEANEKKIILV